MKDRRGKGAEERCEQCGEVVPIGGWPYCASKRNPRGHDTGTYRFSIKNLMAMHKWERRER